MTSEEERNTTRRTGCAAEDCSFTEERSRSFQGASCQLFGRGRHAAVMLAVIAFAQFLTACSAATCETASYQYGEGTPCKGKSFRVKRCANDKTNLEEYLAAQKLEEKMVPNNCKRWWLLACANFRGATVVVPKSIKCNDVMCDRSSMYSNCVEDADCASNNITSVNSFEPEADMWPLNPFTVDPLTTTMPIYSPCCSFFEKHCNGAVCTLSNSCPVNIDTAKDEGWCQEENCWISSAWTPSPSSAFLSATFAAFAALAVSFRGLN